MHEFASIFAACYDYKHESHSEQLHESAIDDVLSFCNALAGPFLIRLLKVDSIFEEDCSTALKEALMPRIYAPLFSLHSLKFEEKDHKIAQKLKTLSAVWSSRSTSACRCAASTRNTGPRCTSSRIASSKPRPSTSHRRPRIGRSRQRSPLCDRSRTANHRNRSSTASKSTSRITLATIHHRVSVRAVTVGS